MTRKNTFRAEGREAMRDIRTMLSGYEPAGDVESVTVEIEYEDGTGSTSESPTTDSIGVASGRLPEMKTGTRTHRVLEVLNEADEWLTNPEIAEIIGCDSTQASSATSRLNREKQLCAARQADSAETRYEYQINARGQQMYDRLGPYEG